MKNVCLVVVYFVEIFFSEKVEENVGNGNTKITWSQWVNESGRSQKKNFQEVLTKQLVC